MKTHSKKKKIALTIILILLAIMVGTSVFHRIKLSSDLKFAKNNGYYDLISVGDHSLNIVKSGNENADRKIVVLSGMGPGFPVDMRKMTTEFEHTNELIYVARAGWDGSDDVKTERTVEAIVEDYRNALHNAGVPAPYVLMAHSMGATYASYWVSKYPDEIEAFVNIDGTYVEPIEGLQPPEKSSAFLTKAAVTLGIGDIFLAFSKDPDHSAEEQRAYNFMTLQSFSSAAIINEQAYIDQNRNETWNTLVSTDVPKLYISARDGYRTKDEIFNVLGQNKWALDYYAPDFKGTEEERKEEACNKWLADCEKHRTKELMPYLEKMGNYKLEYLPGDHFIYKTEPEKCGNIIKEFLESLNI